MQEGWHVPTGWRDKIKLRLRLAGYSSDRAKLLEVVKSTLANLNFYPGSPDLSELNITVDPDRSEIAQRTEAVIEKMEISEDIELDRQDILEQALAVIYGQ